MSTFTKFNEFKQTLDAHNRLPYIVSVNGVFSQVNTKDDLITFKVNPRLFDDFYYEGSGKESITIEVKNNPETQILKHTLFYEVTTAERVLNVGVNEILDLP